MKPRFKSAEKKATELLRALNIQFIPIPVEEIAEKLNVFVEREPFGGAELSGVLIRDENSTIIGVNKNDSPERQRFTIAHELGHFLLHKGTAIHVDRNFRVNFRNGVSSQATDFEEIEANAFAAALLMPEELIRLHVNEKVLAGIDLESDEEIANLAEEFEVSRQAMLIRLSKLELI